MTPPSELDRLAERVEARAIEYAKAALEDSPWDEEEREKLWTADSAFRVAACLREAASKARADGGGWERDNHCRMMVRDSRAGFGKRYCQRKPVADGLCAHHQPKVQP